MKSFATVGVVLALGLASFSYAKESSTLVGRYTGTMDARGTQRQNVPVGLTLTIEQVAGKKIQATGKVEPRAQARCVGEFAMAGTLKGKELRLRNVKPFGSASDCNLRLRLTVEGAQLVGTTGNGLRVQLSK